MTSLGGHGIAYMTGDSPIGEKESYEDTGAVLSRMCDAVTARVKSREQVNGLAENATIPIINALDDYAHPMQMLADLQTIVEHKCGGDVEGLTGKSLAFVGDCQNNVTYDLMRAGALMGLDVRIAGPTGFEWEIEPSVLEECASLTNEHGGTVTVLKTAEEAVAGADIVYADSWMSYGIKGAERDRRMKALMPFQVTPELMSKASTSASFMNCLPAMRGEEQTAEATGAATARDAPRARVEPRRKPWEAARTDDDTFDEKKPFPMGRRRGDETSSASRAPHVIPSVSARRSR